MHERIETALRLFRRSVSEDHEALGDKIDLLHGEIKDFWKDKAKMK